MDLKQAVKQRHSLRNYLVMAAPKGKEENFERV